MAFAFNCLIFAFDRSFAVRLGFRVRRQSIPIRRVALTDMRLKIPHGVRSVTLRKALEKDDVIKKFNESSWGRKRIAKQRRAALTDFERFKLMVARKQRAQAVRAKLGKRMQKVES